MEREAFSFTRKVKASGQLKRYMEITTASGIVRSPTETKIDFRELGNYFCVKLVEGYLSAFSLRRLCDDSWQPTETPELSNCKKTITCCADFVVSLRAKQLLHRSIQFQPHTTAPGKTLCQEKQCWRLCFYFQKTSRKGDRRRCSLDQNICLS